MIRRTASEVLRSLEMRVARLEDRTAMFHPDDPRSQEMGGYQEPVGYDTQMEPPSDSELVQRLAKETVSELKRSGVKSEIKNNVLIIYGVSEAEDFFAPEDIESNGYTASDLEKICHSLVFRMRGGRLAALFVWDWSMTGRTIDPIGAVIKARGRVRSLHIPLLVG